MNRGPRHLRAGKPIGDLDRAADRTWAARCSSDERSRARVAPRSTKWLRSLPAGAFAAAAHGRTVLELAIAVLGDPAQMALLVLQVPFEQRASVLVNGKLDGRLVGGGGAPRAGEQRRQGGLRP